MATSRTSTAKWKRLRKQTREEAQANGVTNCPLCKTRLDWNTAQKPRSAEVDHKIAIANGGTDNPENLWVICRLCNSRKDASARRRSIASNQTTTPFFSTRW